MITTPFRLLPAFLLALASLFLNPAAAQPTWQVQSDYFAARDIQSQIRSMRGIALSKVDSSLFLGYIQGSSTSAIRSVKQALHSSLGADAAIIGNYVSGPPSTPGYTGMVGTNPAYTGGGTGALIATRANRARTFRNLATDDRGYVYAPDGAAGSNPQIAIYPAALTTPALATFNMTASGNGRGIKVRRSGSSYYLYVTASSGIVERWNVTNPLSPALDASWGTTIGGAPAGGRIDLKTVWGPTTFSMGLTVDDSGVLFVAGGVGAAVGSASAVFKISGNGNLQTAVKADIPFAVDVAAFYHKLYIVTYNANASNIVVLNKGDLSNITTLNTGIGRSIGTLPVGENVDNGYSGIDVSPDGRLYVVDQIYKYFASTTNPASAYTPPATSFNPNPAPILSTRLYFDRVLVSSPVEPFITNVQVTATTNTTCNGGSDGSATVTFDNGFPPFAYTLDSVNYTNVSGSPFTISNLAAGNYSVIVRDGANHTDTAFFTISQPPALSLGPCSGTNPGCPGTATGSVAAGSVTNNVGPVNYVWKDGSNNTVGTTPSVSNLPAGTYVLTVSDNCPTPQTCSLTLTDPVPLNASVTSGTTCVGPNDGYITVSSPTGGSGTYEYRLNTAPWQSSGSFTNLPNGSYNVEMRDAGFPSCTKSLGTQVITAAGSLPGCNGIQVTPANNTNTGGVPTNLYLGYGPQSATITANPPPSGTGITYNWSPAANLSCTACQSAVFTPTAPGTYTRTVTISNSNGCYSTCSVTFCVKDPRVPGSGGRNFYVCHRETPTSTQQNLIVSTNLVAQHIGPHPYDKLGQCTQVCGPAMRLASAESAVEGRIHVYPNPSQGTFTLELPHQTETVSIRVTDVQGRCVWCNTLSGAEAHQPTIHLGPAAGGIYFVEVVCGSQVYRTRAIVE